MSDSAVIVVRSDVRGVSTFLRPKVVLKHMSDGLVRKRHDGGRVPIRCRHWAGLFALPFMVAALSERPAFATPVDLTRSIVRTLCLEKGRYEFSTGIFVDRAGHFVTNKHVLQSWNDIGCKPLIAVSGDKMNFANLAIVIGVSHCVSDQQIDLCFCGLQPLARAWRRPKIVPARFSDSPVKPGTVVELLAFATQPDQRLLSGRTTILSVLSVFKNCSDELTDLAINMAVWHGASGAPVYIQGGQVVGIIRGGNGIKLWSTDRQIFADYPLPPTCVVPSVEVIRFLTANGIHANTKN
jgi:Trypsin-like peptidase domain